MRAIDRSCEVIAVEAHPLPYYSLRLAAPEAWLGVAAGQFVMVATSAGIDPYLRRAFSVHDAGATAPGGRPEIRLLAKVVGRGTANLARLAPGDRIEVLGPLGHGFDARAESPVALVAGGVGSAPLLLLERELRRRGVEFDFFYGGKSGVDLARRDVFAALARESGGELVATTEDGSVGARGLVTDALLEALPRRGYKYLYGCGPMGLLARLAAVSREHGVPGEAALETPMGCGFGACLGCAVPLVSGRFGLCCKDGPVLRFDEVRW